MPESIVDESRPTTGGFTAADLAILETICAAAIAQKQWGRAQIVHDHFADYLAVWSVQAESTTPPNLAIARFKRTGTYALTSDSVVVATATSLDKILPTIRRILDRSDDVAAAATG
ncbi:MAG TPA: hypothetical protein VGB82_26845 [Alphaproteobacteria bacterium]